MMRMSLAGSLLLGSIAAAVAAAAPPRPTATLPDAAALELVFDQRASELAGLEPRDQGLDTIERTWRVKRPFGPGYLNSTHWFDVRYEIGGKQVGHWLVDTEKRTVSSEADKPADK